ncbi:prephenate dehydratase [Bacillus shivajii]|uniref:prephenate dehydratase n=1 Tax=Bacillus shivajii TaxID=1983719 RepID=UPI001CFC10EC|nr:prephenate dehydratase [Bacillus shivajii]UCZ54343.1 prephenate dehydratase [Bacillus shivajii]
MNCIGYLGPKGSFTEAAANALLPNNKIIPFRSIPDSMDAVKEGRVLGTVVPLENAIEGSVNITLDYLIHHQPLKMAAEYTTLIEQHLMVNEAYRIDKEMKVIYSHPQAIAQCHQFLRDRFPNAELKYMNSTAAAAKYVSDHPEEQSAAIANELAAKEYKLSIINHKINDYKTNSTRFVLLLDDKSNQYELTLPKQPKKYKTTLMVTLPSDYSGALHQVLSAFAWRKINLSKIESRPMKTSLGHYFFIIDVEMEMDQVLLPGACEELKALGCDVSVLGSYPCYQNVNVIEKETINDCSLS